VSWCQFWVAAVSVARGGNHFDIAPSYGQAEIRVGLWMPRIRQEIFLGCKTMERTREGAWKELRASLERLQTETFDLYQFHAVTTMEELDSIFARGGAMEAFLEARQQGLFKYIGITGHGVDSPAIYLEALRRFDFDSVLFPLNFVQMGNPYYRENAEELIRVCRERNVGTMVIKTITKAPWGEREHTATTWYEPFDEPGIIQRAVDFALSYDVTGLCTVGDVRILPLVLQACENFKPMDEAEREKMIAEGRQFEPLFV
jgi:predicted aldo/keto reductase-like oxidoreductase